METLNRKGHQCVDTEIDYNYSELDGREKETSRYRALVVKKNQSDEAYGSASLGTWQSAV